MLEKLQDWDGTHKNTPVFMYVEIAQGNLGGLQS